MFSLEGDGFTEMDAANLRKNLNETLILGTIMLMDWLLQAMFTPDDDDYIPFIWLFNWTINILNRLETDIQFYWHPGQFMQILRGKILPSLIIWENLARFIDVMGESGFTEMKMTKDGKIIMPKVNKHVIQSGAFEGMDDRIHALGLMTPGISQGMGSYAAGKQIFKPR